MGTTNDFQRLVEAFFLEWLCKGRNVSPNTVASYRDTFSLYLRWLHEAQSITPANASMDNFDPDSITEFLIYLSEARKCCAKTVNCRLAALKSFGRYASFKAPQWLAQFQKIEQIPERKTQRKEVDYLTSEEIGFLLEACKSGSENELLIALLYNTGARISEIITVKGCDISSSETGKSRIKIVGKGRKERTLPLWLETSNLLQAHMKLNGISPNDYLFKGRHVDHLTRSGARSRIESVVKIATITHSELEVKRISPHVFRHSTAMSMLAADIDIATVAIWLGHEHINTTHKYVVSDMKLKEEALAKARLDWKVKPRQAYKPSSDIMDFLISL